MAVVNRTQKPSMFLGTFDLREIDNNYTISQESVKHAKHGGRIVLPSSVLRRIVAVDAPSPFIIKIQQINSKTETYCGVASFEGKEREVLAPLWMCDQIKSSKSSRVKVSVLIRRLASGTLAKFKPLSIDFFDVMNPKKVLESSLSHYTCLNINNTIDISFTDKVYRMAIVHLEPETLIDITNCDLEVEFEAVEEKENKDEIDQPLPFTAFSGHGGRIDGKELTEIQKTADEQTKESIYKTNTPDFKYKLGTVKMIRAKTSAADAMYTKLKKASTEDDQKVGKRKSTRITLRNLEPNSETAETGETAPKKRKASDTSE